MKIRTHLVEYPMLIFLADLTHTGLGVATEAFPLNIGLLKSYLEKVQPGKHEIRLFKYPEKLNSELKKFTPDVVGFSNYTWNSNLAGFFSKDLKLKNEPPLIIWGGTNYPFNPNKQKKFLLERPFIDIHVSYEGEITFSEIIKNYDLYRNVDQLKKLKISGSQSLLQGEFLDGGFRERIKNLSEIPSPYTQGYLDEFFDGKLTPLVETARGCPFTCNFCNAGDRYFQKVNTFETEYAKLELEYIAQKASKVGIGHITFCDNNFGMLSRDAELAKILQQLHKVYNFPNSTTVWTGKNSKERVIAATRILGDKLNISMSVQAMDPEVLKEIKRENIKLDDYKKIADELNRQGRPQHAEVIMPLPGESLESHLSGLLTLVDTKVDKVFSHTLQLLHGTPYKDDDIYRSVNKFEVRYRLVPSDFSIIENQPIFDVEEVAVGTSAMSVEEYHRARFYALIIDLTFNTNAMKPFIKFLVSQDIKISNLIELVVKNSHEVNENILEVFESFKYESKNELWESEEELVKFYSNNENFTKLQAGQIGGNVLFKHRVWIFSKLSASWVNFISRCVRELIELRNDSKALFLLNDLTKYVKMTLENAFDPKSLMITKKHIFDFNIPEWLSAENTQEIFKFSNKTPVDFKIPNNKKQVLKDAYQRYGTELPGLVKLIQRTNYSPIFEAYVNSNVKQREYTQQSQFWKSL